MTVAVQKCLKRVFHTWLPHPPLEVWYDMYENHILYNYFYLLPFSYNASAKFDQNQNWCVIGYMKVKTVFSQIFGHFSPNSSLLVTMATRNKLRERNVD